MTVQTFYDTGLTIRELDMLVDVCYGRYVPPTIARRWGTTKSLVFNVKRRLVVKGMLRVVLKRGGLTRKGRPRVCRRVHLTRRGQAIITDLQRLVCGEEEGKR